MKYYIARWRGESLKDAINAYHGGRGFPKSRREAIKDCGPFDSTSRWCDLSIYELTIRKAQKGKKP